MRATSAVAPDRTASLAAIANPGVGTIHPHVNTLSAETADFTGATASASGSYTSSGTSASAFLGSADLAITKTVSSATPAVGANVTFTLTVTNNGPNNATGVVVNDFLPDGMTYVSDNGGGAYSSGTGLWTIPGTINNGASATLQITATVDLSGQICNQAQITAGSPLDHIVRQD